MATQSGGPNLSDLRAKLGIKEEPAQPAAPAGQPSGEDAEASADAEVEPAASSAHHHVEDYANAVEEEHPVEVAAPKPDFDVNAVDPSLSAPKGSNLGVIVAVAACLIVGLLLGSVASSTRSKNKLYNQQIEEAKGLMSTVEQSVTGLNALNGTLSSISLESFTGEFDEALAAAFAENRPVLEPAVLSSARVLMSWHENIGASLLAFSTNSKVLEGLVERHMESTRNDAATIRSEISGAEDNRNFGIVFDSTAQARAYEAYNENPTESPYMPPRGFKVTYDNLTIETRGEGDSAQQVYSVTNAAGQAIDVRFYELIAVSREQFAEQVTTETALSRYQARAREIVGNVERLAGQGAALLTTLDEVATRKSRFAL